MAIKKTAEEQLVINYMNQLRLKAYKSNRQYWDDLNRRHDKEMLNQLNEAMKASLTGTGSDEAVYELKNSSLQLSLNISSISADLYKKYFDWFANRKGKTPKRILDVGCDNGVVTCFLATLFPDAQIIGIDRQPKSIECATQLAEKLNLSNVSFMAIDFNDLSNHFENNSFDLIVSMRVFHEIVNIEKFPRHWSTEQLLEMDVAAEEVETLMSLRTLLANHSSSEFISCERLPFMGAIARWTKLLTVSGFQIKWNEAQYIQFHELGEQQKMPIFVASSQNNLELLEKVFEFESKEKVLQYFDGKVFKGSEAEILLQQAADKQLVKGIQINFANGSGNMRIECWMTADDVLLYQYSNIGYRELVVFELSSLTKAVAELEKRIDQWMHHGETLVYESVEEREQFDNVK